MTPVEGGVLLGVALLFTTALVNRVATPGLWWATWIITVVGALLVWSPVTLFMVEWPTTLLPGGATTVADPVSYVGGHLTNGLTQVDVKCMLLLLWAIAVTCFVGRHHGVEPLLIGTVAVAAALLTMSTDNLVVLYLSLELQALSLYTLVGFYRFNEERTESALRYLLTGSVVSGFMLLGFAHGYADNATFYVHEYYAHGQGSAWVTGVLLFKVGVVPFHFWAPVVYTPLEWGTLALVLGAGKANVWYLLVVTLADPVRTVWWPVWWAAVGSLVVGAVGGYFQTNVAGVLAYSGVINGGYLLLLTLGGQDFGFGYYLVVYLWGTAMTIAVASVWPTTQLTQLAHWTKLGVATPLVLYYLTLNLGGLPVFPGFFAKLILLRDILPFGWLTTMLVVIASLVPAVYYVGLAGATLFQPKVSATRLSTWLAIPTVVVLTTAAAAAAAAAATVV